MNIKDLKPGSYKVIKPLNIRDLPAGSYKTLNAKGKDISGAYTHPMNPLNPNNSLDKEFTRENIPNPFPKQEPQQNKQNFFDRLTSGFFDTFGGSGGADINKALDEKNPLTAGLDLASGLGKSAFDLATFIPKGVLNTVGDFVNEAAGNAGDILTGHGSDTFVKPHSRLTQNIDSSLQDKGPAGGLPGAFLTGLSETAPFLALFGSVLETPPENIRGSKFLSGKASDVRENLVQKQATAIDEKLGLDKNTKSAIGQRKATTLTGAKTPGQVLAENNIPFNESALPAIDEHIIVRQATKQALLDSEPEYASLNKAAEVAKKNLRLSGTDLEKAKAIIDEELRAYKSQYASKLVGGDKMQLGDMDRVKSGLWRQSFGNKGLISSDNITKSAQYQFGDALKQTIEDTSSNEFVKQLNREEGDFINAKKALDGKNFKQFGKTSLPGRLTRKAVGAVIGSTGGIPGSIVGSEVADYVGEVIANKNIPMTIRQSLINNLMQSPEGQSLVEKALKLVRERAQQQITRPQLAPPSTIFAGPRTYTQTPMKITPAEPQLYRSKTGQIRKGYKSTSK